METTKQEYTTIELQETFNVLGFGYGLCAVEHKETKERGSFQFERRQMSGVLRERIYFNYKKA